MTKNLLLFLMPLFTFAPTDYAHGEHLYGSGVRDSETNSVLTLACVENETHICDQVRWQVTFENQETVVLGAPYSVAKGTIDAYDALLQLDGIGNKIEFADLENDEFAKTAVRAYINGLAKNAQKNFSGRHLFENTTRVYFGMKDMTAAYLANQNPSYSDLQKLADKKGWNWSSKPKKVSHSFFSSVIRLAVKRAAFDGFSTDVSDDLTQSLKLRSQTFRLLKSLGDHRLDQLVDPDLMLTVLKKTQSL